MNRDLPNLMQVRAFVRVADEGSVSRASAILYRAQSVVTRAIADLEKRLDVPLFERHDRARVEVTCYSTGDKVDEVTGQVKAAADRWREAQAMSDAELAQTIERDAIDVLVDLTGHAGALRLGVFALQPAPVQFTWLGYLHSTGLKVMYTELDINLLPSAGRGADPV